jgi:predicted O-methyltransferase YrrM
MALSLETAALAWVLCEERKPSKIVDMGSGFSSFVLRHWAKTSGAEVWSIDDDAAWLEKSRDFCRLTNVSVDNFETWDAFKNRDDRFDLVIYDLGRMPCRVTNVEKSFDFLKRNGIMIVDDMHKFNYGKEVRRVIEEKGLTGVDMKASTTDAHEGRHCWIVT